RSNDSCTASRAMAWARPKRSSSAVGRLTPTRPSAMRAGVWRRSPCHGSGGTRLTGTTGPTALRGSGVRPCRLPSERGTELAAPELEEALLVGTDLHEREPVETGLLVAAQQRDAGIHVGSAGDARRHVLRPHALRSVAERLRLRKLRQDLPPEPRPARVLVRDPACLG